MHRIALDGTLAGRLQQIARFAAHHRADAGDYRVLGIDRFAMTRPRRTHPAGHGFDMSPTVFKRPVFAVIALGLALLLLLVS